MPLKDFIDDSSLELSEVAFVSPEGWFVVRAQRGEDGGLAWLYPIPGRQLENSDASDAGHSG